MDLESSSSRAWLVDFVVSGVDEWCQKLEGGSCPKYSFRKIGDALKIIQKAPLVESLWLVKLPVSSGRESLGEVSDGQHVIEAVFTKATANTLLQTGAQTGSLIQLSHPEVRVRANVKPPRPQLVVDRWVMVEKYLKPPFSPGSLITDNTDIQQRMARYQEIKSHKRTTSSSNPTPHDSPGSFASQTAFSPRSTARAVAENEEEEEDNSQGQFCTQTFPPTLLFPQKPAPLSAPNSDDSSPPIDHEQLLQSFSSQKNNPALQKAAPGSERCVAPPLSVDPSPVARAFMAFEDGAEKSSPIETTELEAHIPASAPTFTGIKDGKSLTALPESPLKHPVAPIPNANVPTGPFQRWRQQTHGVCHIPRYVSKIPRDQEDFLKSLLEAGDSWQPPLVGHVPRPGQVPLALLENLCHAADKQAENPAASVSRPESPVNASRAPHIIQQDQSKAPMEAESDDEEATQGEVEWSQSPPTQQRRQHKLASKDPTDGTASDSEESVDLSPSPPAQGRQLPGVPNSSPPPELVRKRHRLDPISDLETEEVADKSRSGSQGPTEKGMHMDGSLTGDRGNRSTSPTSEMRIESTLSVAETPPSAHSSHRSVTDNGTRTARQPVASSQEVRDTSARKVQVKRTPYPGKATNLIRRMREHQKDAEPPSTFVPATYESPASIRVAGVAGLKHAEALLTVATTSQSNQAEVNDRPHAEKPKVNQRDFDSMSIRREASKIAASAPVGTQSSVDTHARHVVLTTAKEQGLGLQSRVSGGEESTDGATVRLDEGSTRPTNNCGVFQQPQSTQTPMKDVEIATAGPSGSAEASALTKRKREASEGSLSQAKRQRRSHQTPNADPDYLPIYERRRADRRIQMQAIGKPKAQLRQSTSSSMMDLDSSSGMPEPALDIAKRSHLPRTTTEASLHSSTPLTRHSTYGEIWNIPEKARHIQSPAAATTDSDEDVFAKYQAAYPDYGGSMGDFLKSYYFIQGVLNEEPNKIHSSLLDDAIYHHFHSYPPYQEAMGFIKYFNDCIDDPSHHKRIIKFNAPLKIFSLDLSRRSSGNSSAARQIQPSSGAWYTLANSAHPPPSVKDELEEKRRQFLERTMAEAPARATLSQESIESIERWREDAAQRGSPELGSSDFDRSLLHTSHRQKSVTVTKTPGRTSTGGHQPRPEARPTPVPTPKPIVPTLRDRTSTSTAPIQPPPDASTRPCVGPRRPSVTIKVEDSEASFSPFAAPRRMFVGTNTAFTEFDKKYAQTLARKREEAAIARAASVAGGGEDGGDRTGMGINIFSWR
ncbi:hypothetical protein H2200_013250 [Cladophialophora chaetospira]|uniref:Uncharacterized protein n=1 Tax=Cladophialophora chaetospira TaxID=386627 RepID=A0AA38WWF1_9EURO|nr:hypothetical protein H2200_013250 [Cladophialophora chaetospira]